MMYDFKEEAELCRRQICIKQGVLGQRHVFCFASVLHNLRFVIKQFTYLLIFIFLYILVSPHDSTFHTYRPPISGCQNIWVNWLYTCFCLVRSRFNSWPFTFSSPMFGNAILNTRCHSLAVVVSHCILFFTSKTPVEMQAQLNYIFSHETPGKHFIFSIVLIRICICIMTKLQYVPRY